VIDGPTRTLMVVEAANPVPWTKPEELTCAGQPLLPRPGALREGEFAALFASGHVRLIEPRNLLSAFITRQGREPVYLELLRINEHPPFAAPTTKKSRGARVQTDSLNRPEMEAYSRAKTLTDALAILLAKLDKDGMQEFKPLLTESRVREAILAYVRGEEAYLEFLKERGPNSSRSSFEAAKPLLRAVAEKGSWPPKAFFWVCYTMGAVSGEFDGCWVRLHVAGETETHRAFGFAAPILDLSFGDGHWSLPVKAQ
jgi:hypothetical protein